MLSEITLSRQSESTQETVVDVLGTATYSSACVLIFGTADVYRKTVGLAVGALVTTVTSIV